MNTPFYSKRRKCDRARIPEQQRAGFNQAKLYQEPAAGRDKAATFNINGINGRLRLLLADGYNIISTKPDVCKPEKSLENHSFQKEYPCSLSNPFKTGPETDAPHTFTPMKPFILFELPPNAGESNADLRPDHFLLSPHMASYLQSGGVNTKVRGWPKTSDYARPGSRSRAKSGSFRW